MLDRCWCNEGQEGVAMMWCELKWHSPHEVNVFRDEGPISQEH